jgi:tripartite-type tricarboxylate transporter receptor subunit TctC
MLRAGSIATTACLAACLAAPAAPAQDYPARPVRLIAAFPPGTGVDVAARIVAQKITESTGQTMVVENRPGAGGNIAAEIVAKSAADGYTLLFTNNAHTINPGLYRKLAYDPLRDFAPIGLAGTSAMLMVSHPSLPARTVKD